MPSRNGGHSAKETGKAAAGNTEALGGWDFTPGPLNPLCSVLTHLTFSTASTVPMKDSNSGINHTDGFHNLIISTSRFHLFMM